MKFTALTAIISLIALVNAAALPEPVPEAAANPEAAPAIELLEKRALATVYTKCKNSNQVALTFDDGPYIYEKQLSDLLTQNGAKGTFFINGNNYDCVYSSSIAANLKYTYQAGHQIGDHTWDHKDLTTLTWDQIHDEMWRVEQAMQKILGVTPALMRPPYGNYNDLVRSAAAIRNQSLVLWDFDSGDSVGETPSQSETLYNQAIAKKPKNILALNHETYQSTVTTVIPYAIKKLKTAGYQLVTVSECLGIPAYHSVGKAGTRDSTWHC
ncbi:carbohydrate esterase family 4 protein [Jaapia argillacea MUCL 33604]|uniref:Carbohydrate esterase family 4 protein n=1 Tax=Jaapia argillacea MUCL 33604 TaxID=933084 RepID=A0A067PTA1_9AGAM|nr:carbohydrate esterase family 4 protein [Jaapia argillacea MUCL 33604]